MKNRTARRVTAAVATLLVAGSLATLPGCIVKGRSYEDVKGTYIGDQTLSRIKPGETNTDLVLALLGQPSSRTSLDSGAEIWKWEYRRIKTSSGSVLLVFDGSDRTVEIRNVYVEMKDNIVTDVWRD